MSASEDIARKQDTRGALLSLLSSLGSLLAPVAALAVATFFSIRTAWIFYGVIFAMAIIISAAYELGKHARG